mmetsp:Transcript_9062/g.12548  ORF Transcript_9062/g.12548 Transcript_9062/m.12548 type:complete len:577 (+) Transcript_9062:186-1916(+)
MSTNSMGMETTRTQESTRHQISSGKGGVNVVFENVIYSVPVKTAPDGTLNILKGLSGSFVAGKMTALMGPSGSGKSTLLDVLSGRKTGGSIEGTIRINGKKPTSSDLKSMVGYVEQFDTLVDELTVAQMLAYTAALKLPKNTTADERRERVEEVIRVLGLNSCRDTVIGSVLVRGISGGQAKRVNIGLALVTRPKILFLDEPTSGLDSRTANEVVELVRQLAYEGERTVVCTIHAPTGRAFAKFDDLHMLHDGQTIYDGALNEAQAHFESLGYVRDSECSLPEWLVDLTSELPPEFVEGSKGDLIDNEKEVKSRHNFADQYRNSVASQKSLKRIQSVGSITTTSIDDHEPPSEMRRLLTLLRFRMIPHYKSGQYLGVRFGDKILFSLLILSLFFGIGDKTDSQSILSISSLLFFITAICGFGAAAFVPSLTLERPLYYRELADGCYKPATYFMAKFIEESIMAALTSFTFAVIMFFGLSLQGSFFIFVAGYYLTTLFGIIMAYAVAALVPSMEAANAILPTIITIWMYFGGQFIVFDKIPVGWYWFSWTSFIRYAWGTLMLNQHEGTESGELPIFF